VVAEFLVKSRVGYKLPERSVLFGGTRTPVAIDRQPIRGGLLIDKCCSRRSTGQTDGWTDTRPLHRSRTAYNAGGVSEGVLHSVSLCIIKYGIAIVTVVG